MPRSTPHDPSTPPQGRPPLAVWPCAQIPADAQRAARRLPPPLEAALPVMAPELAHRLIIELTSPGSLVVDVMCGTGTVLVEAARTRRRAAGMDLNADCTAHTLTNAESALDAAGRGRIEQLWHGDARHADTLLPDYCGRAALVVAGLPDPGTESPHPEEGDLAHLAGARFETAMREVLAAAAHLLVEGGCAVVVCGHTPARGRWMDRLTPLVRAAGTAGLDYVQHVIALSRPIRGDRFGTPLAADVPVLGEEAASAAATLHTPAHDDVLVFTRSPAALAPAPPTPPSRAEVPA